MITIDASGVANAIQDLDVRKQWLRIKTQELVQRLTDYGVELASVAFEDAAYDGVNDVQVSFEESGELTRTIIAAGSAVLFIEFGAGVTYGFGHPEPQGYGPGTYPGKGNWVEPYWFYTGQPGTAGGTLAYNRANTTITRGNPPSAAMYQARKQMEEDVETIALEVFSH